MNWTGILRTSICCVILVILHYTLRPLLGWPRAPIDFMLIAALFGAVRMRPGYAAVYGLLLGFIGDALNPNGFGAGPLAMTLVAFGASWLKAVFFADNLALNAFFFFVGKWVFDLILVLAGHRLSGTDLAMQVLVWSPLSAAVTALAGALALTFLRPLMEPRPA
jgi:cell shape-determining protein MreD